MPSSRSRGRRDKKQNRKRSSSGRRDRDRDRKRSTRNRSGSRSRSPAASKKREQSRSRGRRTGDHEREKRNERRRDDVDSRDRGSGKSSARPATGAAKDRDYREEKPRGRRNHGSRGRSKDSRGRRDDSRGQKNSSPAPAIAQNPLVWLDFEIEQYNGSKSTHRVEIELFEHIVPETADRFQRFCRIGSYENVPMHRIIPGFMAQGGDISHFDGTGGLPKGETRWYPDENFVLKHLGGKYLLSCANAGKNTNSAQFFITFGRALPHLDGKHVVFGQVVDRLKTAKRVMQMIENCGDRSGVPRRKVTIVDCGEILDEEGN
ncbi:unnamed protein product [Amoebophrya sp. A120]|nr:unnamed protein product [Amoebophrya sp. A120]|eukprot:GSA120T00008363001.1